MAWRKCPREREQSVPSPPGGAELEMLLGLGLEGRPSVAGVYGSRGRMAWGKVG